VGTLLPITSRRQDDFFTRRRVTAERIAFGHAAHQALAAVGARRDHEPPCFDNLGHRVSTMVSNPVGLRQQPAAAFVRTIESASIGAAAFGLPTALKFPNVFGRVSANVKTVAELRRPVMTYGIGVVLE